jgi:hypothetical protein
MKKGAVSRSFYFGLLLFILCTLSMIAKIGVLLLVISHFLPGFLLGILLIETIAHSISSKQQVIFTLLSTSLYIVCVFLTNIAKDDKTETPVRLILSSSIGALLLSLFYDLVFKQPISLRKTFLLPLISGFIASLLSAFCLYYFHKVEYDQYILESVVYSGIFTIFPIWYCFFTWTTAIKYKTMV